MPKTKPRIDKKKGVTFRLVHRSQHDPLIADETAPQHVLQEVVASKEKESHKEEQIKYGIYFDDNYDYLKHLKSRDEFDREWEMVEETKKTNHKLKLPSSVFPSVIEEDEGMLNKAAPVSGPQLNVDPDIIAAMDDDFDLEDPSNQLTDDYLTEILESGLVQKEDNESSDDEDCQPNYSMSRFTKERYVYDDDEEGEEEDEDTESIDSEDEGSFCFEEDSNDKTLTKEETKSVFTEYSLTSSVLPRNEGLSLIDEKFEAMFEKEYGNDMDLGALDLDDIEGSINPNKCQALKKLIQDEEDLKQVKLLSKDDKIKTLTLNGEENSDNTDTENDLVQLEIELDAGKHGERLYDCESVLSTYSNLYNHPKLIRTERSAPKKLNIDPVSGVIVSPNTGLTKKNLRELDVINDSDGKKSGPRSSYSRISRISELSERDKNESPEERKARKAAFKEMKRERRIEKKANRTAFKMESDNQKRDMVHLRNNVNSMKLI
ncbi:protein LTV1 homolog [Tetranychus urticae]|uniref:Protein LTV1 homolog n=1 Tax=Tetranychus urticae TaxID=32264 RepID=T1L653_TETUR|nr:protein LTV1 homolog [Tetranychus urticae]